MCKQPIQTTIQNNDSYRDNHRKIFLSHSVCTHTHIYVHAYTFVYVQDNFFKYFDFKSNFLLFERDCTDCGPIAKNK